MFKQIFLCVDVQNDFFKGGLLEVPNAESIRMNVKKLIEFARGRNIPVCYTQDLHKIDDKDFKVFPANCVMNTTGQLNIDEATIESNDKVFTKQCVDVFDSNLGNKEINEWLKNNKVKDVYLFGLVGNICVEAAAMGLRKLGINVYIFEQAVMWMDMEKGIFCEYNDTKENSMARLRKLGCHLVQCKL
jgi:nicotinamidase-related amidase